MFDGTVHQSSLVRSLEREKGGRDEGGIPLSLLGNHKDSNYRLKGQITYTIKSN